MHTTQSKPLDALTEEEFSKLKETGLLHTIYPKAPETFKEIRGVRPAPFKNPDFKPLLKYCEDYMQRLEDPESMALKEPRYYIYQIAINCIYGRQSGVWDFINKNDF